MPRGAASADAAVDAHPPRRPSPRALDLICSKHINLHHMRHLYMFILYA